MNNRTAIERNIPAETKISKLSPSHVTVRGKLKSIDTIKSLMTKTKCIGYLYTETKQHGKKLVSKTKCKDFYIEDETGKIKVIGKDLIIVADVNKNINKITNHSKDIEYLLLEDSKEYVLVGDVETTKIGEMVIKKATDHYFTIEEAEFHDFMNNKTIRFIAFGMVFIIVFIILYVMLVT